MQMTATDRFNSNPNLNRIGETRGQITVEAGTLPVSVRNSDRETRTLHTKGSHCTALADHRLNCELCFFNSMQKTTFTEKCSHQKMKIFRVDNLVRYRAVGMMCGCTKVLAKTTLG